VAIAFNGGKDCMVMLHLTFAHLRQEYPDNSAKLQALYIYESDPFKEVESFIQDSRILYDLDLVSIQGPMKGALTQMLLNRPNIKAMLMGTRIGDPGSKGQINFSPTDGDWPSLMRVNPILEWEYKQVWTFLRGLTLPYPTLYDHGYTSLGNKRNTCPNPNLAISADDLENTKFKPAYQLEDGSLERAGRGA
jgi:FAD synthetase